MRVILAEILEVGRMQNNLHKLYIRFRFVQLKGCSIEVKKKTSLLRRGRKRKLRSQLKIAGQCLVQRLWHQSIQSHTSVRTVYEKTFGAYS